MEDRRYTRTRGNINRNRVTEWDVTVLDIRLRSMIVNEGCHVNIALERTDGDTHTHTEHTLMKHSAGLSIKVDSLYTTSPGELARYPIHNLLFSQCQWFSLTTNTRTRARVR